MFYFIFFFNLFSFRLQQELQASKVAHQTMCSGKQLPIDANTKDNDKYDTSSGESDDESVELWSNEVPVYIRGEQRWISGVTEQTTCLDIIEALLIDEGIIKALNDGNNNNNNNNNNNGGNLYPTKVNEYVIIERWRRMEQPLDGRTKILKIWTAWGTEQSEVRTRYALYDSLRFMYVCLCAKIKSKKKEREHKDLIE
jgi:hypothetical protein